METFIEPLNFWEYNFRKKFIRILIIHIKNSISGNYGRRVEKTTPKRIKRCKIVLKERKKVRNAIFHHSKYYYKLYNVEIKIVINL